MPDKKLPEHIAIIMDGNGRWATARGLTRAQGHRAGVRAIEDVVRVCDRLGIKTLTLYAFSTENWSRPPLEVGTLMALFSEFFTLKLADLLANNVRIRMLGDRKSVPGPQRMMIEAAENKSRDNTGLTLNIAFNYGAHREIFSAAQAMARRVLREGLDPESLTQKDLERELYDATPVDLLIRTGGESRVSNFLLYQLAYAEMSFVPEYWPDFDEVALLREIDRFQSRDRRFGGLNEEEKP